jgi:DNA-binding PadR family transcriptional regulator
MRRAGRTPPPAGTDRPERTVGKETGTKIMRDIVLAFARVHILHHASVDRIFGLEMIEELKRHGYDISPGTLYPMLHALEEGGVLTSRQQVVHGKGRRYYRTTRTGDALLAGMRTKIRELVDEVAPRRAKRPARRAAGHPPRS